MASRLSCWAGAGDFSLADIIETSGAAPACPFSGSALLSHFFSCL